MDHRRRAASHTPLTRRAALGALALSCTLALALAAPASALAWTAGQPLTLPFPRLGMWWPDTYTATPAQLARYDWMVLGPWDESKLAEIKALNPAEMLLNSTSASELDIEVNEPASDNDNAEIAAVPTSWLLTQVGASLTASVSATATTLPVSAVTTSGPDGTVALFESGDILVFGDELAVVQGVNAAGKTLTVKRGAVKTATPHPAGERAASAITFWPGSVVMDVSTACPRVTVDATIGPETWDEYNARRGAALALDNPRWDGILVDRSDGDESWLVGNSTARSIDPDRTNRLPATYDAFDGAWNAGLYGYELRLRGAIGDNKLIMVNWGAPNYALLNGDNFEGFPNVDAIGYAWQQEVLGPSDHGPYFDWLTKARQPNLTTIETYQDDAGADPTGDGSYTNPATQPGFVPNYRKMRFGLTTALMGDGFFSYEISTQGHGSLGLLWFDEYTGAGRGRGWLGSAIEAGHRVADPLATPDLAAGDGAFDTAAQVARWDFEEGGAASATCARDTSVTHSGASSLRVNVTHASADPWDADIAHPVSVTGGKEYTVTFWARSDSTHTVDAWIQQAHAPWNDLVYLGPSTVTPQWQRFVVTATCDATESKASLVLAFARRTGTVWVDDVTAREGNPDVWLRTFQGGMAIVNATKTTTTVTLPRLYKHLAGSQVPSVNNGHLAGYATVQPSDGVLLAATNDTGGLAATLTSARADAVRAASKARGAASVFAKLAKKGSASARRRASNAASAWRTCASRCDALNTAITVAQAALGNGTVGFPAALLNARNAGATAANSATSAKAAGKTTSGTDAIAAIGSARTKLDGAFAGLR